MKTAGKDLQGRNLASREAGIFGLQPGEDVNVLLAIPTYALFVRLALALFGINPREDE